MTSARRDRRFSARVDCSIPARIGLFDATIPWMHPPRLILLRDISNSGVRLICPLASEEDSPRLVPRARTTLVIRSGEESAVLEGRVAWAAARRTNDGRHYIEAGVELDRENERTLRGSHALFRRALRKRRPQESTDGAIRAAHAQA